MKYFRIIIILISFSILNLSCEKGFLEKRPDKALTVPSTLSDFRALMDYTSDVMNYDPGLPTVSIDDFYLGANGQQSLNTITEQNAYIWAADIYQGRSLTDWNRMYQQIFYCNVVLEGLEKMDALSHREMVWSQIKGAALFHRAMAFYNLAQLFSPAYQQQSSAKDLGIPLRISSDLNLAVNRSSLEETYSFILNDLLQAKDLLPKKQAILTRPTKNAALALLARLYLQIGAYQTAEKYADESLLENRSLLDYNTLNTAATRPFPVFLPDNKNEEVIFYSRMISYSYFNNSLTYIDPELYQSYQKNDIRKQAFFTERVVGKFSYKGSYSGSSSFFSGLTTREIYLIKAECAARDSRFQEASLVLNTLLSKRYKSDSFLPKDYNNDEVLSVVLQERRKELIGSGLRWSDLRRLNLDSRFAKTISRQVNENLYTLLPNDKRYVLPIPDNEIQLTGIKQNER